MATNKLTLDEAYTQHAAESLQLAREAWAIRPALPPWDMSGCVCMQAWNSVTGRTCPVHGYSAPMQITC